MKKNKLTLGTIINPEISCCMCELKSYEIQELNRFLDKHNEISQVTINRQMVFMCDDCFSRLIRHTGYALYSGEYSVPRYTSKLREWTWELVTKEQKELARKQLQLLEFSRYMFPLINKYKTHPKLDRVDMYSEIKTRVMKWNDENPKNIIQFNIKRNVRPTIFGISFGIWELNFVYQDNTIVYHVEDQRK